MELINALKEFALGPIFYQEKLKEKRRSPRLVCGFQAYAAIDKKDVLLFVTDVSVKGVKVESPVKLRRGFEFAFTVKAGSGSLSKLAFNIDTLLVQVVQCRKKPASNRYIARLLFTDSEARIRDSWVYYLFSLFGIDKPDLEQKRELRRDPYELNVLFWHGTKKEELGTGRDIGLGGMLIEFEKEITPGTSIDMKILSPHEGRELDLKGTVVRADFLKKINRWLLAVRFLDMEDREYKALGKLILSLHKSQR